MKHALRAGMRVPAPAALVLALAAFAGAGCAAHRPPAPPRPAPGYERLRDTLAAVDASGLAGRRIALDPGHGGVFRGALGVGGLTEAEVNLAVALRLRDLLAAHGARVLLTRDRDRDFLTPADSTLRADLDERLRLAAAFDPDLFVSIHHNADPRGAHDVNETQTYYKLGDEGPSLDAAQDVHRALVRNVGIAANRVVPGNFHVLRGSAAPALLTETSYITDPDVERRLRLPEKQELEAQALFIGLARYFARRVPVIEEFAADWSTGWHATPGPGWELGPVLRARVAGDFDLAMLELDGVPCTPERRGAELWWRPAQALANGAHEALLRVRLAGVGAARERRLGFSIARPVARLEAEVRPDVLEPEGGLAAIHVRALDGYGLPAGDSLRVRVRAASPDDLPNDTTLALVGGEGWFHPRIAPRLGAAGPRAAAADFFGEQIREPGLASLPPRFDVAVPVRRFEWDHRPRSTVAFLRRMPGDSALTDAVGAARASAGHPWLDRDGFAVFELDAAGRALVPALPGYRVWPDSATLAGAAPVRWTAIAGGALHGRRIVLDPEGGGDDAAGQGPGGTRAASLNLECARILAGMLTAAGADVRLTRAGDLALADVERVQAAEAFHAERFLRIAHRAAPPRLGHHPASPAGRAWAERAAQALAARGRPAPAVAEEAQYVLQQTSCPALFASPGSLADGESEAALLAPGALRAEAYALYLALAREWATQADWPADSLTLLDPAGRPVTDAAVTLGGALVLVTDASGRIRFARTEPGPLEVGVEDPRVRYRGLLLDSQRGAVLTGTKGR